MHENTEPNPATPASRLLDAADVAEILSVPKSWVYAETRAGRLPHVTVGRYRRYRLAAVEAWIVDHERGPTRPTTTSAR